MRKLILFVLLLIAAHLVAQTPPSQFSGLLTDSTDYTTSSNWTTPSVPAAGSCYTDSIFGINACRISDVTDCPVNGTWNPKGSCAIANTHMLVDYAKTDPWSNDNAYYVADNMGWVQLFSWNTGAAPTYVRLLRTYCGTASTCTTNYGATRDYGSSDSSFSGALWGDFSNWLWANNASTPHVIYYTGSSTTNSKRYQLKAYNADTDTISVVHDFTSTINTVNGWGTCSVTATSIDMQREGNQSDDDRYWAFGVTNGTASGWCAVLVYDKTLDSVIALQTLGANGMCGVPSCASLHTDGYPNWVGMSPSGTYVIVNWQNGSYDQTWTARGEGTEVFTNTLGYLGIATAGNGHGDVGYDVNGVEVYVSQASTQYGYGKYAFGICNLANANSTLGVGGCRTYVSIPCTWGTATCPLTGSRNNTYFISMRGSHGAAQGWMSLSTQTDSGAGAITATGNGGWEHWKTMRC